MDRECQNALELAHWIAENYSDIIVNYPDWKAVPGIMLQKNSLNMDMVQFLHFA